jgi:hypothetical protein
MAMRRKYRLGYFMMRNQAYFAIRCLNPTDLNVGSESVIEPSESTFQLKLFDISQNDIYEIKKSESCGSRDTVSYIKSISDGTSGK